jgi:hypothetical protein
MVLPPTSSADQRISERRLLDRLLGMYSEQQRLYGDVLTLSRRQRELIRNGAPLPVIRKVLNDKKAKLAIIHRLELVEENSKQQWRQGRPRWSADSRASLHRALESVGRVIEEILACEEENDRELLHQCR